MSHPICASLVEEGAAIQSFAKVRKREWSKRYFGAQLGAVVFLNGFSMNVFFLTVIMKYPQLVSMPSAVSDWLEEQLEARGLDAVYSHYIISLLHSDSDVVCSDEDLRFTCLNKVCLCVFFLK